MRRLDKQITDPAKLEEIMRKVRICHLGLFDGQWPYVLPVHIGYDTGRFYFHGAREGRKMEILRRSPQVAFQAQLDFEIIRTKTACNCSTRYESVMGRGLAVVVEEEAELELGLMLVSRQCGVVPRKFTPEMLSRTAVVRVDIESLSGKASPAKDAPAPRPK